MIMVASNPLNKALVPGTTHDILVEFWDPAVIPVVMRNPYPGRSVAHRLGDRLIPEARPFEFISGILLL